MAERNRLVISGSIGASGQEQWSTGITYAGAGVPGLSSPAALQDWAEDAFAIIADPVANPVLFDFLSTSCSIDKVTAYYYPAAGPALAVGMSTTPSVDGLSTAQMPPQCAVVMSLITGLAGRSFRGRCYWPSMGATFNVINLGLGAGDQQAAADEFAAAITAIGNAGAGSETLFPAVYSVTRNLLTLVSQVGVGQIIDTQRRRRDGLPETYLFGDVG